MVNRQLVCKVADARSLVERPLPSLTNAPVERRYTKDSDHAPTAAQLNA